MHLRNLTWTPEIMVKGIASFEDGHFGYISMFSFNGLHNSLGLMKSATTNFMDFLKINFAPGFSDGFLSSV